MATIEPFPEQRLDQLEVDLLGELRPAKARSAKSRPVTHPGDAFASAIDRLMQVVVAGRELELAEARRARIDWGKILEEQEPPPPLRPRACPWCTRGRPPRAQILADPPVWGHWHWMNRVDAADMTPEAIERDGCTVQGAFLCECPSHGPFELRRIQRDRARGWL
jgi:hypothetical protein